MNPIVERLLAAAAGGCECLTKTPELQYHAETCKFRLCVESMHLIVSLEARVGALTEALIDAEEALISNNPTKQSNAWSRVCAALQQENEG